MFWKANPPRAINGYWPPVNFFLCFCPLLGFSNGCQLPPIMPPPLSIAISTYASTAQKQLFTIAPPLVWILEKSTRPANGSWAHRLLQCLPRQPNGTDRGSVGADQDVVVVVVIIVVVVAVVVVVVIFVLPFKKTFFIKKFLGTGLIHNPAHLVIPISA